METTFNFNNVETNEGPSYIEAGVHDVVIAEVTKDVLPYGDNIPCMKIKFQTTDGKASHTEDFSLDSTVKEGKQKSMLDWTSQRLKHLGTKIIPESEFNKLTSIDQIAAALIGKQVRIKFGAREFLNNNGEKRSTTTLPFMYFAEEISVNPTKLKYDPNNNFDFKRLETPANVTTNTASTSDLPF